MIWVPTTRCLIRYPLKMGEVRRRHFPTDRHRAAAYDFACPSCAERNTWFVSPRLVPLVESELISGEAHDGQRLVRTYHPAHIASDRQAKCVACGKLIRIQDSAFALA